MAKAKKLPSGNWRVQARKTVRGKEIKKSFTAANKRDAEAMAYEWQFGGREETKGILLRDAYEQYISSKEKVLSPTTIKAYRSLQHNTFLELMDYDILDLDTITVQKAVSSFASNHSPKCVRNAYSLLTATVKMFAPEKAFNVTLPQKKKTKMYIPDDNDMRILLDKAKGTRLEIPILLAVFGPMRRGEICALTDKDIKGNYVTVNKALVKDTSNQWIVKPPKTTSSDRVIEYPSFVIEKIKGIKGNITDMTPAAITDAFPDLLRAIGLPHFRFHDLRHYSVSTLHAEHIPEQYIMARGGWQTNYTMNNVYNHTIKNRKDENEEKITSFFEAAFG